MARELFARAGEGDYWQLAVRLGAEELLYNRRNFNELLNTAYLLLKGEDSTRARRATLWAGEIAALVGREMIERDDAPYLDRLRPRLVSLLGSDLSAIERADAGNALAKVGDPRFRPDAWHLPDEPLLGFVEIPAGPFIMGSDPKRDKYAQGDEQPQHELTLPRYFIARYPVTVAQFRVFVEASGHTPRDEDSLLGPPNHPVVNVTWHEACIYCDWLTEALKNWPGTPQPLAGLLHEGKWRIVLPSEAEWEKAARGGIEIPATVGAIQAKGPHNGESPLQTNPNPGRVYPWGDEFDSNKANTIETGLNTTSAVGCFAKQGGASPYGVLDLSGNVWEWTRSLWGKDVMKPDFKYPYDSRDGREALEAPDQVLRVLRGGSFIHDGWGARCAFRVRDYPNYWDGSRGFRVAASPF